MSFPFSFDYLHAVTSSLHPSTIQSLGCLCIVSRMLSSNRQAHSVSSANVVADITVVHNMLTNLALEISFNCHGSKLVGEIVDLHFVQLGYSNALGELELLTQLESCGLTNAIKVLKGRAI